MTTRMTTQLGRHFVVLGCTLALLSFGCGIGTIVTTTLPPVDAMDDMAATSMGVAVTILILANDEQDDDLVTDLTQPVDAAGVQQGTTEIDFLSFPEKIIYTPPPGFTGTVTFDYDITALGTQFDYTTTDTATVTVTVRAGLPDVVAVSDSATIDINEDVEIDVLLNDSQDSDEIDSFSDAVDDDDNVQMGSVTLLEGEFDTLLYTPPDGFEGTVIAPRGVKSSRRLR